VDVEAAHARNLLAKLIDERFITITNVKITAMDRDFAQKCGLVYGSERVIQMTVEAEALFFREWTLKLMPTDVKKKMGIIVENQPVP
jgi:hypothetical protein